MRAHLGGPLELVFLPKLLKFRVEAQVETWARDALTCCDPVMGLAGWAANISRAFYL